MGLTIHYTLFAPETTDAAGAREIVLRMRRRAFGFKQRGRVDMVHPLGDDRKSLRWAREWMFRRDPHHPTREYQAEIMPRAGWIFPVSVGKDCEPLWLGLCQYPQEVLLGGKWARTRLKGWRLHGFCKTQYASLHGWEYFQRCHCAVIDLLVEARSLGMRVVINDEGEYWPRRSLKTLRVELDQMNGVVAAAAGALKDLAGDDAGTAPVQSPIFKHPHFEHLEAAGAKHTAHLTEAVELIKQSYET
ncbi:MAG: hypothetical protein WCO56_10060 [Verrucomicrobiota bacterium]